MLKKFRSVLAIMLSVVLVAACLSGCGGESGSQSKEETPSTESGNAGEGESSSQSKEEVPSTESEVLDGEEAEEGNGSEEEVVDLGGREINLVSWGSTMFKLNEDATDEVGQTYWARMKEMEEKYNCKFVLTKVDYSEIAEGLRAGEMSGTPYADVVMLRQDRAISVYKEGLLMDLSQVMDGSQFYQPAVNLLKEDDGKFYTFAIENENHVENFLMFNKEHFINQGIDVDALYQEVLDGKWTMDRMFEIVDQATVVKDGVTDVYGCNGISVYDDSVEFWMTPFNAKFVEKEADGTYTSGLRTENMQKALETLSTRMVQSGSFWIRENSDNWDTAENMFKAGKIAMVNNGNGISGIKGLVEGGTVNFEMGVLPMPKVSEDDEYCYTAFNLNVAMMPKSLEKDMETAQAIGNMISYIYSPVGEDLKDQLERTCSSFSSDEAMMQILVEGGLSENFVISSFNALGLSSQYKSICRDKIKEILKGETSISAGIDAIDEAWQAAIDEYNAGV